MNWMLPGRSIPHIAGLIAAIVLTASSTRAEGASSAGCSQLCTLTGQTTRDCRSSR